MRAVECGNVRVESERRIGENSFGDERVLTRWWACCNCGWRTASSSSGEADGLAATHMGEMLVRQYECPPLRFETLVRDGEDWWPR